MALALRYPQYVYAKNVKQAPLLEQYPLYALNFNGGYISVGAGAGMDLITGFTIMAWVKPSTIAVGTRTILYRGEGTPIGGYALNQTANKFRGYFYDTAWRDTGNSVTTITANTLYNVTLTYNKTTLNLYVNGVLERSIPFITNVNVPAGAYTNVGAANGIQLFLGSIFGALLYNQPLNQAQIQHNMNNPLNPIKGGLVLFQPMLEGSGLTVADQSGLGNNGAIIGGVTWNRLMKYEIPAGIN